MRLHPACARCGEVLVAPTTRSADQGSWSCSLHGVAEPCWRATEVSYEAFAEHLVLSRGLPTWVPWPLPPGWAVTDFGCVGGEGVAPRATFATSRGVHPRDGGVSLTVVTEEPGIGLGAHLAGTSHTDPGRAMSDQPAALRLRLDGLSVPLWAVPEAGDDGHVVPARTVLAGEAQGRWLWLVITPAEAVLGLVDRAQLSDAAGLGPELLTVAFGSVEDPADGPTDGPTEG